MKKVLEDMLEREGRGGGKEKEEEQGRCEEPERVKQLKQNWEVRNHALNYGERNC